VNDYHAFGGRINSYSRENSMPNRYLFNKGSELKDALSLDVYSTRYRVYDPWMIRWWQVDPKVDEFYSWTPYNYSYDNPIRYNDPNGDCPQCWLDLIVKIVGNLAKGSDQGLKQRYQPEPKRGATVTGIRDTQAGRTNAATGKPVGDAVVRVDNPHGSVKTPHINVNPKISGVPDPHTPISGKTLTALKAAGSTLEAIGQVAKPVAIATDAVRIGNAIVSDGGVIGESTLKTSASVAGGWGGAITGASIMAPVGMKLGGSIGTLIGPGGGTAIGAGAGGLVFSIGGGIGGAFGGSWLGEKAATSIIEAPPPPGTNTGYEEATFLAH
jgi:RHS repeat-associated protein